MTCERAFSTTLRDQLASSGIQPVLFIGVNWGGAIGWRYYGDRTEYRESYYIEGRIQSLSPIRSQTGEGDKGSVSTLACSLIDEDEELRGFLNSIDPQDAEVRIYLGVDGLSPSYFKQIGTGRVSAPIVWDESDHELRFDIVSPIRSEPICYAPEEGDIADLHSDAIGRAWPVCFGTVIDVPAKLVTQGPRGILAEDIDQSATSFKVRDGDTFPQGTTITIKVGNEYIEGQFDGETFNVSERNVWKYQGLSTMSRDITDPDYLNADVFWIADATKRIVGNMVYVEGAYVPDSSYPRYNYCVAQQGNKCWFQHDWIKPTTPYSWVIEGTTIFSVKRYLTGISDAWRIKAGSPVSQKDNSEAVYVANELESSQVLRVRARRTVQFNDLGSEADELVDVPASYYSVDLSDESLSAPGGRTPTTITFAEKLADRGSGWDDSVVYVSLVSSLGSNTADVIEWILNNYTNLTPDEDTFDDVATALTNYPSHFAITERMDALEACADIAWQARCGLFTVGECAFIRYLSAEPSGATTAFLADDATVLENSVQIGASDLQEVVTRFIAKWRESYADEETALYYEENTARYGTLEAEYSFWIYQTESLVIKSAAFWAARYARVWRILRLIGFMEAAEVAVLDWIRFSMADIALPDPLYVLAKETELNSDPWQVGLMLWTPVEIGTTTVSSAAFDDDSGDSPPGDPSTDVVEGEEEIESVPPLVESFGLTTETDPISYPGKITADEGGDRYRALIYPDVDFSGTPIGEVTVKDIGATGLGVDDTVMVSRAKDGSHYTPGAGGGSADVYPARVISKSAHPTYNVWIYKNGPSEAYETGTADVLELDSGETIPSGTWVIVTKAGDGKYYFTIPQWLAD